MGALERKLIDAFTVLVYYNILDESKGKKLSEVPSNIRNEVEIKSAEMYTERYMELVGGETNGL